MLNLLRDQSKTQLIVAQKDLVRLEDNTMAERKKRIRITLPKKPTSPSKPKEKVEEKVYMINENSPDVDCSVADIIAHFPETCDLKNIHIKIEEEYVWDEHYTTLQIFHAEMVDNPHYESEMEEYDLKLKIYEEKMKVYKEKFKIYQDHHLVKRRAELEKELRKVQKELEE